MNNSIYEKIEVTTKEKLNELYKSSALTLTGVVADDENLNKIVEWIKRYSEVSKPLPIHIIKGKVMNKNYRLTGDNAYKDDLILVSIKTEDIKQVSQVAIPRFEIDGRWFSDIVDNNAVAEKEYKARQRKEKQYKAKQKPKCALIGEDGNIFNLMGIASKTLKRNGMQEEAKEMCNKITSGAKSYDEALCIIGEYVDITSKEEVEENEF